MNKLNALNFIIRELRADARLVRAVQSRTYGCVNASIDGQPIRLWLRDGQATALLIHRDHVPLAEAVRDAIGLRGCEIRTYEIG